MVVAVQWRNGPASRGQHQRFTTVRVLESCCEMHKSNVAHTSYAYMTEKNTQFIISNWEFHQPVGALLVTLAAAVKAMKIEREHWFCIRLIGLCHCPSQRWLISECLLLLIITSHMAIIAITLPFLLQSGEPRTCSQNSQKCKHNNGWRVLCIWAAIAVTQLLHSMLRSVVLVGCARPDRVRQRTGSSLCCDLAELHFCRIHFLALLTLFFVLLCIRFARPSFKWQLSHRSGLHPQITSEMAKLCKHIRQQWTLNVYKSFGWRHKRAHVVRPTTIFVGLCEKHFRWRVAIPRRENTLPKRRKKTE